MNGGEGGRITIAYSTLTLEGVIPLFPNSLTEMHWQSVDCIISMSQGSPFSSGSSDHSDEPFEDEGIGYEAALEARPTKRRRMSFSDPKSLADEEHAFLPKAATASRVKPLKKTVTQQTIKNGDDTVISNGKIVDARSSFATLNVNPWLIASLSALAILRPTAIQKQCIPEILAGKDVIGGSRTGSGKTVAFTVPMLQKWAEDPMAIYAVILTPTRSVFTSEDFRIG